MHLKFLFLLFFVLLECSTSPSRDEQREGVIFPIRHVHKNISLLERAGRIFSNSVLEDSHENISHRTFTISLQISISEQDSSKKLTSHLMVDTGSDSILHKKNYFFMKGKVLSSPVYTANEKYEEKLEVFIGKFYHPDGKFLKQEKLFVTQSLESLPVDGILGNSFFSNYVLWIDYPHFLALYKPSDWINSLKEGEYEEIQAVREIPTHWVFQVSIYGKHYWFLFDTGADYTVFDSELAKNFFYLKDRSISYMEFSGRLYESKLYLSPEICISKTICSYNIIGLSSSSLSSFIRNHKYKISGLLGMNWIKNYKFALDYTQWKLYIAKK